MIPQRLPPKLEHTRNLTGTILACRILSDATKNTAKVLKAAALLPPHLHQKITTGSVIWIDPFCGQKRHAARPGAQLQMIAEPISRESVILPIDQREVHAAASSSLHESLSPRDSRDIQFEIIVNMFAEPEPFLLMAGHNMEEISAFNNMPSAEKEQHLIDAFLEKIAPTLDDKVLNVEERPYRWELHFGGAQYKCDGGLGRGCFGGVSRFSTADGQRIAVKTIREPDFRKNLEELRAHFYAQGRTLKPCIHGITRLLGAIWTPNGELLMVQECMSGGNYFALNENLKLAIQKGVISDAGLIAAIHATAMRDATKGLIESNTNRVLHNDIKDENLIFEHGKGKICDFGVAKLHPENCTFDAIRLGIMGNNHIGSYDEPVPEFQRSYAENNTPKNLLKDAHWLFKGSGVGGPHVRAVMDALGTWNGKKDDELIAACNVYLTAARAVEDGASWHDLKGQFFDQILGASF